MYNVLIEIIWSDIIISKPQRDIFTIWGCKKSDLMMYKYVLHVHKFRNCTKQILN